MKTYSRIVIRFAWIAACTGRIDSAKAEGAWTFVDKAASITKTLWDLGSSVVSKFSDYPVYSTAFVLENYIDLTETYDHGSKTMVRRSNWRDPVDQSSKYKTVTTTPIQSGLIISTLETTSPDPFPHAFGNCSWTCSYSSDPSSFLANGRRTTIFPTQYRVRSTLLTASKSIKDLIDPIPVTVVWFYEVPNPNGCGTVDVTGSKSIETAAYTDLNRCPLLNFPATGLSKGGPTLLLSVRTDVK